MNKGLVDNWLHGVLSICEALVVPLIFASFKGHIQVSYLINMDQV